MRSIEVEGDDPPPGSARAGGVQGASRVTAGLSEISGEEMARVAKIGAAQYFRQHHVPSAERDDVLSDAMYGAVKAAQRYRCDRETSYPSFASQGVKGAVIDGIRSRHGRIGTPSHDRRKGKPLSLDVPADEGDKGYEGSFVKQPSFETDVIRRIDIEAALRKLPARSRGAVVAYYYEGAYLKEIADELGVTEARVSQLLARARATMRKHLSDCA